MYAVFYRECFHSSLHFADSVIVSVVVRSIQDPPTVTVTLSEGFSDFESCSFMYGPDETYMSLPREGSRSTSNNEITFVLDNLSENSEYYYNMSCAIESIITLVIQGSFRSREVQ